VRAVWLSWVAARICAAFPHPTVKISCPPLAAQPIYNDIIQHIMIETTANLTCHTCISIVQVFRLTLVSTTTNCWPDFPMPSESRPVLGLSWRCDSEACDS
jgi:hypothetical protein